MAEPFLGEIRLASFSFPPKGWAFCNGQLLAINQNPALFSLLGTTYGGNGQTNFALPNLQGRIPHHAGNGHSLGELGGVQAHTLSIAELPSHTHAVNVSSSDGTLTTPAAGVTLAASTTRDKQFASDSPNIAMSPASISSVGGSQPHPNLPPYLALNFVIALQGIFPSPT